MRLGMTIESFSEARPNIPIDRIRFAESCGFDSVWSAEIYGADAMTPLAYIGALTEKIRLGTNIAALAARSPANLAMCAQTIDAMVGKGRMMLGLAVSGPQIVEGWHGQPWGKPNNRLRDAVAIIKKIYQREGPVAHQGLEMSLPYTGPGSSGLGKPLRSVLHCNPKLPVYLGAGRPTNVRLVGEIADGWLTGYNKWVPGRQNHYLSLLKEGMAKRKDGKTLKDFPILPVTNVVIDHDVKGALARLKPHYALYIGGMGAKQKNFHKDNMVDRGFGDAANKIQELFFAGRRKEAEDLVPDEFVDQGALVGPPERIRERYRLWVDTGATDLILADPGEPVIELMGKIARA
jgi:F420-dependent oxidoreductase-like protein